MLRRLRLSVSPARLPACLPRPFHYRLAQIGHPTFLPSFLPFRTPGNLKITRVNPNKLRGVAGGWGGWLIPEAGVKQGRSVLRKMTFKETNPSGAFIQ